ncbi:MAG: glycosyltransferase family 2 protein [Elusimicrobia bacterium]|nr:glycosyltransferase family 2 protein [Elusimicrobiota bacterium]
MSAPLSVVLLTRARPGLLRACLDSVLAADLEEVGEVLVVVNGPDPDAHAVAAAAAARQPRVRALEIPPSSRGRARNLAAASAAGRILHFLDDDVVVPPGLFAATAARFAQDASVAAVGGPNMTPPDSSKFETAVGHVLSSRLGAWNMRARYRPVGAARAAGEESLMLCSLAFRADADGPEGLRFDEKLASAEENLLLERIRRRGGRALYDPDLFVYHRRRSGWRGFLTQTFRSGAGRRQTASRMPSILRPVHLAPPLFAVYLTALAIRPSAAAALPLAAYATWLGLETAAAARAHGMRVAARGTALIPLHHLAYAAGFLLGPFFWVEPEPGQRRSTTSAPPMPPPAQAASIP